MDTSVKDKKTYHHGDLRQVLISEAAKMIREEGEAALSMRKLATNSGVSRTAPYHHFEDKQDLLCAVAEEGFRKFDALFANDEITNDLQQYLQTRLRNYVNFAVENAEYYDLMFSSQIWKSEKVSASLKAKAYASFKIFADSIISLCEKTELPEGIAPLRVAQLSWATFHGLSRLMIDGIYVEKTAIEAIFDTVTKLVIPSSENAN